MNTKKITESSNPVLAGSLPALKRAAAQAKKLAAQTGTRLIVSPQGQPKGPLQGGNKGSQN